MPLTVPAEQVLAIWIVAVAFGLVAWRAYERGRDRERQVWEQTVRELRTSRIQLRRALYQAQQETAERHRVTCGASIRLRRLTEENRALTGVATDLMRRYAAVCPTVPKARKPAKAAVGPHGRKRSNHRGRS